MAPLSPLLIWGLFPRVLALVYLVALVPLWWQIVPFAGPHGCAPLTPLLDRIRRDFPWHARLRYFPTLFWLSSSPAALRSVVAIGCLAAVAALYGGPWSALALAVCFVVLLSVEHAVYLIYPWDRLLLEAGFLAIFLPVVHPFPDVAATGEPAPLLAFAFHLLLVRLLVGFGKTKFIGHTRHDALYLRGFLINTAFPQKLGWYAHHLPRAVHRAGLVVMAVCELFTPPLSLLPGPVRLVPFATTVLLMVAIGLTGNFGYFNLLVIVLCVPLLDLGTSVLQLRPQDVLGSPGALAMHLVLVVLIVGGMLYFPYNSWCTRTWLHWPALLRVKQRPLRWLLAFYRALAPFGMVNAYGVFQAQTMPGLRFVPVLEGSMDGETWHEYGYRFMPTTEHSPPRWIAPHHPRFDQLLLYEGLGINSSGFMSTTIGGGLPYLFSPLSLMERLMRSLMQPESPVRSLLGADPFHGAPPEHVRVTLFALEPVSIAEHRATGRWWRRYRLGVHLPAISRQCPDRTPPYPGPELFHWDDVIWRRRTPRIRAFEREAKSAASLEALEAAVCRALELPADAMDRFWTELIEGVRYRGAPEWQRMREIAADTRRRFGAPALLDFERVASLLAIGLAARYEHRLLDPAGTPLPWPVVSYFHAGMLFYALIAHGRQEIASTFADEAYLETQSRRLSHAAGLWLMAIFRPETLAFQARAARLLEHFSPIRWAPGLPGFAGSVGFLSAQFPDADGERILPLARRLQDGDWETHWATNPPPFAPAPDGLTP